MKIRHSLSNLRALLRLSEGEVLSASQCGDRSWLDVFVEDNLLTTVHHRSRVSYRALRKDGFLAAVRNLDPSLRNIDAEIKMLEEKQVDRVLNVHLTGDSKIHREKHVFGFVMRQWGKASLTYKNCDVSYPLYVECSCWNELLIDKCYPVVVVENAKLFENISWCENLLKYCGAYICCRYPQGSALRSWMKTISNEILYFPDLDLEGLRIYDTEYKACFGERISAIIPDDWQIRISEGDPDRYCSQIASCNGYVGSKEVRKLVEYIRQIKKGYDQEGFCF